MSKPDLNKLTEDLVDFQNRDPSKPEFPTAQNVRDFAKDKNVDLAGKDGVIEGMTKSFSGSDGITVFGQELTGTMAAPVSPKLAAQAQAAAVNAAAGGSLMGAGIEIQGPLKATVHDRVELTFQNSYLKNTQGNTLYTHIGDVTIKATDVRLTASAITIDAKVEERNTVETRKESYRYAFNLGFGTYSTLSTPTSNNSASLMSLDFSGVNSSAAVLRFGLAWKMTHKGSWRQGVKGLTLSDKGTSEERQANLVVTGAGFLLVLL